MHLIFHSMKLFKLIYENPIKVKKNLNHIIHTNFYFLIRVFSFIFHFQIGSLNSDLSG